jgi:hypothetical protein
MNDRELLSVVRRFASAWAMAEISVRAKRRNALVSLGKGGACVCHFCNVLRAGVAQDDPAPTMA